MRNFNKRLLPVVVIVVSTALAFTACGRLEAAEKSLPEPMKTIEKDEGIIVAEADREVLFYRRKAAEYNRKVIAAVDKYARDTLSEILKRFDEKSRPHYIHPLYGLDGELLTEDYPFDHLHHHGIFWAWHQVYVGDKSMGDGWELKDIWWDVADVQVVPDSLGSAGLRATVFWKSPHFKDSKGIDKPFVKEVSTIRVHRAEGDIRRIDFEISLLALAEGVRIGGSDNVKGYGGFSVRLKIPDKGFTFTGTNGQVKPKNTAVEAGPWLDFSGDLRGDGKICGVAVLCHKSIPGYPRPWILRRRNSMQNPVFPGREPVPLSMSEPLVLRYRLILHRGEIARADLDKLQAQYNAE